MLNEDGRVATCKYFSSVDMFYAGFLASDFADYDLHAEDVAENISRVFDVSLPIMDSRGLRTALVEFSDCVDKDRQFWTALFANNSTESIRREFFRQAWKAASLRSPDQSPLPRDVGILLVVNRTVAIMDWWLRESNPLPTEQFAELLDEVVVSPLVMVDAQE